MRRKSLFLPILLVFVFALSFSFNSTVQEVAAGDGCPPFACLDYCLCQLSEWGGVYDFELEICDLTTHCFSGDCYADPCL